MSKEIARRDTDDWVEVIGPIAKLADMIAPTDFVPKSMRGKPAYVASAILTGRELQLGPMTALRGINVIDGRPSLTTELLTARVYAAGHKVEWNESTDNRATVTITRADGLGSARATFTMKDAERAGLASRTVWRQYPADMLRKRAFTRAVGMACPDIALGLETSEHAALEPSTGTSTVALRTDEAYTPEIDPKAVEGTPEPVIDLRDEFAQELARRETEARAEPEPRMVTMAQHRKIGVLIGEWSALEGIRLSRVERRALIGGFIGNPELGSERDLTLEQASAVIERLQAAIEASGQAQRGNRSEPRGKDDPSDAVPDHDDTNE